MQVANLVEVLLRSVQGSSVSEIEYEANGLRLRLVRDVHGTRPDGPPHPISTPRDQPPVPAPAPVNPVEVVRSPMSGTFFRASAPEQPPFVEVGQIVEEGQQLAVVEAMKMLHAVEADQGGRIIEIPAANAAAVDAGTPLFIIEPQGENRV